MANLVSVERASLALGTAQVLERIGAQSAELLQLLARALREQQHPLLHQRMRAQAHQVHPPAAVAPAPLDALQQVARLE